MQVGPFALTPGDIVIILGSGSLLLALHLMLAYTKFGKSLRATSNNSDLAQACGINSDRVINMTWFIAGILTAAAGVALSLEESSLLPSTGFTELFVIFGAVVLGGIGRPYGAMLGALVVGMLTELSGMYANPAYKSAIAFVVVIVVLLIRPQGILSAAGKTS
jgi:branched-chain amino acid transport system permease protein/neutral amino acid transport system permease protein